MYKIRRVYICDGCKRVELARSGCELNLIGDIVKKSPLPADWVELDKVHYCPTCHEVFRRVMSEICKELKEEDGGAEK